MKKYMALILSVLFVLGFAANAFAVHAEIPAETQAVVAKGTTQISLGGEIRIRGEYQQNTSDFNDNAADHKAYYDQRIRLNVEAKVTPNTTGFVQIEVGNGERVNNYTWGVDAGTSGTKGVYGKGEAKRGDLQVAQAWILNTGSGLLGIPAGVKVGHMPLALGNKLFFNHTLYGDDAIVFFMDPTKELHVGLITAKLAEGNINFNDDSNGYVGLFTYKAGKTANVSGDITYVDDQAAAPGGLHVWNFGLRGDAKFSGFGLKADIELQSGKAKGTTADTKYKGYALLLGADYTLNNVKLVAEYGYGSGDKTDTTDVEVFVTALGQSPNYTYVYDYRTATAAGAAGTGIANTQYVKVGASSSLAKGLTGGLDLYILRANKVASGKSKTLGTEIDWIVKYQLDKNLVYYVEGGYLMAGGFYDSAANSNNADDAYAIRHGISLSF